MAAVGSAAAPGRHSLPGLAAGRPFLEGQIRQRVRALPSVSFHRGRDAVV
ncbi:MAG TPA: hypothetical protein VE645_11395 [Pseudonocardiaceae bacterium]|nr:hypothetical protein [Pseudonocardiaceae bacterium]